MLSSRRSLSDRRNRRKGLLGPCVCGLPHLLLLAVLPYVLFILFMDGHISIALSGQSTTTQHPQWESNTMQNAIHGTTEIGANEFEEEESEVEVNHVLEEETVLEEDTISVVETDEFVKEKNIPEGSKLDHLIQMGNEEEIRTYLLDCIKYWTYSKPYPKPMSPIKYPFTAPEKAYVTFEPDLGGFNNIRMGFENVLTIALALNRTLVIPPRQQLYLLDKPSSLSDYYDMEALAKAIPLLSTKDYLSEIGVNVSFPQEGYVRYSDFNALHDFLRKDGTCPKWNIHANVLAIPSISACESSIHDWFSFDEFRHNRKSVEIDESMMKSSALHFRVDKRTQEYRLFGNWHSFLYFANPQWFEYTAAFLRDNLHFKDSIVKTAASISAEIVAKYGRYQAMHVRRGDFQYKQTRISIDQIVNNVQPLLDPSKLIYISTDEKNKTMFDPLRAKYKIAFFDEFSEHAKGIEKREFGMIEQSVCALADLFIGTELSTFSAYITRMRASIRKDVAKNKEVYLTTFKYSGKPQEDNRYTNATWMRSSKPRWPHAAWSRDFAFSWV